MSDNNNTDDNSECSQMITVMNELPVNPRTYEEAHFVDRQAAALIEGYDILIRYGYDYEDLVPLMHLIEATTTTDGSSLIRAHRKND
jgi:hypothetical protein